MRSDIHYAARQLLRAPSFTLIATLSLAIGIGAVVGGVTMVRMAFFQTMAVPEPENLLHIYKSIGFGSYTNRYGNPSYLDFAAFSKSPLFEDIAGETQTTLVVSDNEHPPAAMYIGAVTPNFFRTLGTRLYRGRMVSANAPEIVLAEPYWRRIYNADEHVLGRIIKVNGDPMVVVGIGPEAYYGGEFMERPVFGWMSLDALAAMGRISTTGRGARNVSLSIFARPRPGIDIAAASSRLTVISQGVDAASRREDPPSGASARAGRSSVAPRISIVPDTHDKVRPGEWTNAVTAIAGLALVVFIILAIACINVAGLLFARAVSRQHEIAVRIALGASRRRLFAQLFSESIVLATLGAVAGCFALYAGIRIINSIPELAVLGVRPSLHLLWSAILGAAVASILFGLLPVLQSLRSDVRHGLGATHTGTAPAHRARGHVLMLQIAVSCALLIVSFSSVSAIRARLNSPLGYPARGLLVARFSGLHFPGTDTVARRRYWEEFRRTVRDTPGVQAFTMGYFLPFDMHSFMPRVIWPNGEEGSAAMRTDVDATYFSTVGLGAIRGRVLDTGDTLGHPPVAVINETYARVYRRNVGDMIEEDERMGMVRAQIVGMVRDVGSGALDSAQPIVYYAGAQQGMTLNAILTARVRPGTESAMATLLEQRIMAISSEALPPDVMTMSEYVMSTTKEMRVVAGGSLAVGALELALASIGLYGILLFNVFARRREIGVRLALGAAASQASWAVMRPAAIAALRGLAIGACTGACILYVMQKTFVSGVGNPVPYAAALIVAVMSAAVAAYSPARRAAAVNPAEALRYE
jgi:predicted permease